MCGESEQELNVIVGSFIEVCKIIGLKVEEDKSKLILFNREKGLECNAQMDGMRLEHVSE